MMARLGYTIEDLQDIGYQHTDKPVLVRSTNTGTVFELGDAELSVVTDEMVLCGCKLPVGTKIILIQTK